jgi:prepilin-type processing-associated H-X9-DG protein
MEMTALFDSFDKTAAGGFAGPKTHVNRSLAETVIPAYLCPSAGDPQYDTTTTTGNPLRTFTSSATLLADFKFTHDTASFTSGSNYFTGGRTHYVAVHGAVKDSNDRMLYTSYCFYGSGNLPLTPPQIGTSTTNTVTYSAYGAGCTESGSPNGCMPAIQIRGDAGMYLDFSDINDGTSSTIMMSEDSASFLSQWAHHYSLLVFKLDWASPINEKPYKPFPKCATSTSAFGTSGMYQFHDLRSAHSGGVNSLYADGSVSLTSSGTDLNVVRTLLNRMDNETAAVP